MAEAKLNKGQRHQKLKDELKKKQLEKKAKKS